MAGRQKTQIWSTTSCILPVSQSPSLLTVCVCVCVGVWVGCFVWVCCVLCLWCCGVFVCVLCCGVCVCVFQTWWISDKQGVLNQYQLPYHAAAALHKSQAWTAR